MRNQRGFTLLETLIAFIVLVFGLLGAVALQAKAKQATFDSMQRAAALGVANDVIDRMRANSEATLAGNYNGNISSGDTQSGGYVSCINNNCLPAQVAAFDREQWRRAIRAVDNTGSLSDAQICISTAGDAEQVTINVIVSWDSRQQLSSAGDAVGDKTDCGGDNNRRRVLSVDSFLFV
ncbi:type IV pilus modification protein PilV [Pseudoalteromonas sp. SSDWG2]|uniref:type IV pilus modification protein PilV n=1 Tax=Pseudoalteromonas sp. SSDWG2 TaxID=3139391 RepID=UPI003BAC994B